MAAHTRGANVKAVRINFDSMMRARDYFCHNMPMILIVERIEDSHAVTNADTRRWL
jgi:hypothetical protein